MKWITNPDVLAEALAAVLDMDATAAREGAEYYNALGAPKKAARAALAAHKTEDPDVATVPVLEKYGCPDADLDDLLAYVDDMFAALAALRSGELILDGTRDTDTLDRLRAGLTAVGHRLVPRVQGVLEALTNAHYAAGGNPAELARALDVAYGTVAKRSIRRKVSGPGTWEKWALGESDPSEYLATEVRPGWIVFDDNGRRHQAQSVSVYGDGMVDVSIGTAQMSFEPGKGITAIPHPAPFVETSGQITGQSVDGTPSATSIAVTTYTRSRRFRSAPAVS